MSKPDTAIRRRDAPPPGDQPATARLRPADIKAAASLVREGIVYDLARARFPGMPLPPMHPPFTVLTYRTPHGLEVSGDPSWPVGQDNTEHVGFTTELVTACLHTGAHIDALGHICAGVPARWHGGGDETTDLGDFGLRRGDGSQLGPIISRGVLADVARYRGVDALPAGDGVTAAELQAVLAAQRSPVSPGDVVLLRTGYGSVWPDTQRMAAHAGAGLTLDAAQWLTGQGVVAVGADTEGIEQLPSAVPGNPHPVHLLLLRDHGIPLIEMLDLEQLAGDGRHTFLFIALPVKIRGASGAMADPVAVV